MLLGYGPSMPLATLILAFAVFSTACAHGLLHRSEAPVIQLGRTTLVGRNVTLLKQDFFGGIPFAKPPVGPLRYRPPVLQTTLDVETFDASNFGADCPQQDSQTTSEDCLTINVFRPSGLSEYDRLPVMTWIYGGGFLLGAASVYNGSGIVAQSVARGTPVIYVNLNYRLGPLGFPQGQEAQDCGALNLGLKDQLAALEWIQANIGTFGGDKSKVTVFGESAGAISIGNLFLNSGLEKLARAAIFESGSAASSPVFAASRRERDWQTYVANVPGCAAFVNTSDTFSCLQAASLSTIMAAANIATIASEEEFPWVPVLDGPRGLIPDLPSRLWAEGSFSRLPFIAGTNLDEGTLFTPQTINSSAEITAEFVAGFSPSPAGVSALDSAIRTILQLYPDIPALGSPFNTGNATFGLSPQYKRFAAIFGDMLFHSQRRLWSQTATNHGLKTFGYLFSDAGAAGVSESAAPGSLGISHDQEIIYVYGGLTNSTASSVALSRQMTDYWVSFATGLDPNDQHGNSRPNWPEYTPWNQVLMSLNGNALTSIPDNYRAHQIDFLIENVVTFDQ